MISEILLLFLTQMQMQKILGKISWFKVMLVEHSDTDTDTDIFHLDSIYKSEERKKNAELANT